MAHTVLDVMVVHELDFLIPAPAIEERRQEWIKTVLAVKSRADHIRGLCRFGGMELVEYDSAVTSIDAKGGWRVQVHSKQWMLRQTR